MIPNWAWDVAFIIGVIVLFNITFWPGFPLALPPDY